MKRNYSKIVSLLLVSLIIVFVSCKKDKLTDPNISSHGDDRKMDSKTENIVKRIKTFGNQLEDIRRGTCRSDFYIDIDSAMWNIEALFNSTFSMPDEKYVEKKVQELTFDINVHRDNKLSMYEVNTLYEDIIQSVKNAYINDGIDRDKGLMSIIVDKGDSNSRSVNLKVTMISGRMNTNETKESSQTYTDGPFDVDGCWYYGEYGGTCDDPFALVDAAELLEDTLNYHCKVRSPLRVLGTRNLYVDLTIISLHGNEYQKGGKYRMFYKKNCNIDDLYIKGNDMNFYYNGGKQVIFECVLNDPQYSSILPDDPTFMEVNIDGVSYMEGNNIIYDHQYNILYGTKCEVENSVMGKIENIINY